MHKHLDENKRYQIYSLRKAGLTQKKIASIIGVHPSTICRELKRNKGKKGYRPKQANSKALKRKTRANSSNAHRCSHALRTVCLRYVEQHQWSPQQISGAIPCDTFPEKVDGPVSHETIYPEFDTNFCR